MITLQIKQLCTLRGIKSPLSVITKAGISQQVAYKYLTGEKKNLTMQHIEILCKLFRCTPNDLFAWVPKDKTDDYPENPLQKIRLQQLPDLHQIMNNLTLEEVKQKLGTEH